MNATKVLERECSIWEGCYDDSWKGLIVDDAFAHPAKFARGLIERIYTYLLGNGYLRPGDTVVDPFGGVGLGGIIGASRGIRWKGCELESKFVVLAERNFDLHRRTWEAMGDPKPEIRQGDSRKLCEVLGIGADCVVGSPPYSESLQFVSDKKAASIKRSQIRYDRAHGKTSTESYKMTPGAAGMGADYGQTQGQLGSMPPGSVDAVLSSPPYSECLRGDNTAKETAEESKAKRRTAGGSLGQSCRHAGYGSEENLGNLPAGSVADAIVGSPPFEGSINDGADHSRMHERYQAWGKNSDGSNRMAKSIGQNYGNSDGQLGCESGDTFWSAAKLIATQCYLILKPSGVAVWVCKDFVRNKQRVPFSDDWRKLCEACGFEMVEWIHASLVKEKTTDTLFGQTTKRTERKSFFRRLAEKKGSPRIDHEDVLVMRKT